ncbi:MAG: histidinol dehydrogenase [Rikenellaceae bacterium]|nr:histidinol dehydrogenase [Rikenellaceae bacterium]
MNIYQNPESQAWAALCRRAEQDNSLIAERVEAIVERVAKEGDAALFALAEQIDGVRLDSLAVSEQEFLDAEASVSDEVKAAIENAIRNIEAFHRAQLPSEVRVETQPGVVCVQRPVPISRVGLYIPGGTAPLFSTVLMLALPAKIAGCEDIILCTPTNKQGRVAAEVLYAARRCGVTKVFKAGGAQAVAAMAYGTESVPKVYKIFGPGNRYVTLAKQLVAGRNTSIDMPAGPSEVMVMADGSADAEFVAADMLSQAEHGRDSQAIVVCDSVAFAERVTEAVERQMAELSRADYVAESLKNSRAVVFDSREQMIAFANEYAAEHLIISMEDAWGVAAKITAAGSIFIGNYSPESAGDYASGTNHTLPTSGWAHSCSGVNIDSFMRKMTIQELSRDGIESLAQTIVAMAEAEGLEAHANAVKVRIEKR